MIALNSSNFSLLNQTYRKVSSSHVEKIIIYLILFVISSIGNLSFLYGLLKMKKRKNFNQIKSRIHSLFINLCIGDLMVNFFEIPYKILHFYIYYICQVTFIHLPLEIIWAYTDGWLAGKVACKLLLTFRTFGFYLSSTVLIAITISKI